MAAEESSSKGKTKFVEFVRGFIFVMNELTTVVVEEALLRVLPVVDVFLDKPLPGFRKRLIFDRKLEVREFDELAEVQPSLLFLVFSEITSFELTDRGFSAYGFTLR